MHWHSLRFWLNNFSSSTFHLSDVVLYNVLHFNFTTHSRDWRLLFKFPFHNCIQEGRPSCRTKALIPRRYRRSCQTYEIQFRHKRSCVPCILQLTQMKQNSWCILDNSSSTWKCGSLNPKLSAHKEVALPLSYGPIPKRNKWIIESLMICFSWTSSQVCLGQMS